MGEQQEALSHLKELVDLATEKRDREVAEEFGVAMRRATAAGRLLSGNTIAELLRVSVEDLRIRSELFVRALASTWGSFGPDHAAIVPAVQTLKDALGSAQTAREAAVQSSQPARGLGGIPTSAWDLFRQDCGRVERDLTLRLREWALQQEKQPVSNASQTTTVTLTGDNNTIVAGLMNSTTIIQVDAGSKDRLLAALAAVHSAVETARSLEHQQKIDTLELVADAHEQLTRSSPNKGKLVASLQGIATTIQTVGALSEAYGLLRSAAALIGLHFP